MSNNVIFLDIDGVLNSDSFFKAKEGSPEMHPDAPNYHENIALEMFDPKAISLLNTIVEKTQAVIVISSSWRLAFTLDDLRFILNKAGLIADIFDKTDFKFSSTRYNEINWWLRDHKDIDSFIILDDLEASWFYSLQPYVVQTTWAHGLLPEHVDLAITLMNRSEKWL